MNLLFNKIMYPIILNIFVFLFGVSSGSFLNCVIYRLEKKQKLAGRSYCPDCKKQLKWQDIIPVFSFLFLKGKCRYCKNKISIQYPLVEISTALIFSIIFNFSRQSGIPPSGTIFSFQFLLNILFLFYIAGALIIIFAYDLKHYIIPDKVLFPTIIIAVLYRIFNFSNFKFQISNLSELFSYVIAALLASGFFLAIFLFSRGRWMGFGDVKLAVLMGFILGFPDILVALFLAFFLGAIAGVMLIILKKKGLKSEIPFGPFLIAGTFLAMFWGKEIIEWYL
ncbi:MAG: prepilin peptidase [Candidatus Staskawiczbacteria bacterium]|nr:prepilin peptidase [Candidatus Staskawiczbacteria bacterium]